MLEVREDNNKISVETRPYLGYDNIVVKDMTSSRLFLLQAGDRATYIIVSGERLGLGLSDYQAAAMDKGLSMCHEIIQAFVGGD